ncbi:endonuclease III domain-containing protein [Aspergillus affinis]|uniref:endonuclease III domain-containing protein n=1 Tax=Aspergillus affinis TaxID=1070780 RepID=UPI0022FE1486|nr:amidophosphoribosyltransferase [Aspergillus affinis]KAI9042335.1 amidophosphoribosyltransferase [Aspergillus affinis]
MERRTTRSSARQAALLATNAQSTLKLAAQENSSNGTPKVPVTVPKKRAAAQKKATEKTKQPAAKQRKTVKTKPATPTPKADPANELPHNLGAAITVIQPTAAGAGNSDARSRTAKAKTTPLKTETSPKKVKAEIQDTVDKATVTLAENASPKKVTKKKTNLYGLTPGVSPFPDWVHPTPQECEDVNRLLSTVHGDIVAPTTIPEPSLTVTGCGEVPSVLDALIRTLLSGATTGNNSARAFSGLVQRFGILEDGIGKGSVNWDAVRQASLKDVFDAIKSGGLADVKSKNLKAILDMVHEENQERRDTLMKAEKKENEKPDGDSDGPAAGLPTKDNGKKQYEIACADQNVLSLNHLHNLSTEQAMVEMVKYPGIGPKTAACVLLFCLQRPCFAVDTHIFRICKWLNWVPPTKASEVTAFSHLEVRIPDHLKYSLHQLLIRHGKTCPRCRAITGQSSAGWKEGCVIDHLVTRTGKRKGAPVDSSTASKKKRASRKAHSETDESQSESELSELETSDSSE